MALVHNTETPDIETASADYKQRFAGAVGAFFLETQARQVLSDLQSFGPGPLKILELGGGHGQLTAYLLTLGHQVAVQGSSPQCFQNIMPLAQEFPTQLSFVSSSLWQIPAADQAFDVIIAVRLLAHVEKRQELLAEMSRLARIGLILDFPSKSALNFFSPLLFCFKRKIEGNTRPYFSYSKAEMSADLFKCNFKTEQATGQFFFPMGLHRAMKCAFLSRVLEGLASILQLKSRFGSPVILLAKRNCAHAIAIAPKIAQ